jgi:threonine/homoserine/homoserine lactone efflux protein
MTLIEISFALLVLLASPGPTNALLAMAGAQDPDAGLRRLALPLLVLAAYLATVLPLTLWGDRWLDQLPQLRSGLTLCAAVWVTVLALRLWRTEALSLTSAVTPLQIGLTTLLNPKALVIGLVLLPKAASTPLGLGLFAALVLAVSTLWLHLGASLPQGARPMVNRGGAVWLGLLAVLRIGRGLSA